MRTRRCVACACACGRADTDGGNCGWWTRLSIKKERKKVLTLRMVSGPCGCVRMNALACGCVGVRMRGREDALTCGCVGEQTRMNVKKKELTK